MNTREVGLGGIGVKMLEGKNKSFFSFELFFYFLQNK